MSDYLFYCAKCNSLVADMYEDDEIICDNCGSRMTPLHIDEEKWNDLSDEEKVSLLNRYRGPQIQKRRESSAQKSRNASHPRHDMYQSGEKDYEGKISGMSIAAFIFSILGCIGLVGVILGIIDVTKTDGRKKGLSIAAIVVGTLMLIVSISIAASSSSDTSKDKKEISSDTSITTDEISVEGSAEITEKNKNGIVVDEQPQGTPASIDEQVLFDQEGVKVSAVEYVQGGIWGDGVKLLIENNTSKNLTVGCEALIVNDYMISDLFSCTIAAGKQAYETLDLYTSELNKAGIDNVGLVEAYFRVYDADDWEDIFKTQCITIKTSNYDSMDTSSDISGTELVNQNGVRIVGQYVDEDSFWGTAVLLYIENNSDKNLSIDVDNMSVNGFMVTPYFSSTVYSGKKAFEDITILSSDLENNGITSVDDIELSFKAIDPNTYDTVFETGPVKFSTKK